jgi:uncharacterized membrane protein YkgB
MKQLAINIDNAINMIGQHLGIRLMEISMGLIYSWFGALKLFPGISPAESLAGSTLSALFFHSANEPYLVLGLGIAEVLIGVALLIPFRKRIIIYALMIHMFGTLTPLILFPEVVFGEMPMSFTIVGQYIMKNLVLISVILHLSSYWKSIKSDK